MDVLDGIRCSLVNAVNSMVSHTGQIYVFKYTVEAYSYIIQNLKCFGGFGIGISYY